MSDQFCPICKQQVRAYPRYPSYICSECIDEGLVYNGKKVTKRDLPVEGKLPITCLVKGISCVAREAHLGGVVIQLAQPQAFEVMEGITRGEKAVQEGRTLSQDEAKERLKRWLK